MLQYFNIIVMNITSFTHLIFNIIFNIIKYLTSLVSVMRATQNSWSKNYQSLFQFCYQAECYSYARISHCALNARKSGSILHPDFCHSVSLLFSFAWEDRDRTLSRSGAGIYILYSACDIIVQIPFVPIKLTPDFNLAPHRMAILGLTVFKLSSKLQQDFWKERGFVNNDLNP